jgi:hypothetical protein
LKNFAKFAKTLDVNKIKKLSTNANGNIIGRLNGLAPAALFVKKPVSSVIPIGSCFNSPTECEVPLECEVPIDREVPVELRIPIDGAQTMEEDDTQSMGVQSSEDTRSVIDVSSRQSVPLNLSDRTTHVEIRTLAMKKPGSL